VVAWHDPCDCRDTGDIERSVSAEQIRHVVRIEGTELQPCRSHAGHDRGAVAAWMSAMLRPDFLGPVCAHDQECHFTAR